jgi:hypothetical protein
MLLSSEAETPASVRHICHLSMVLAHQAFRLLSISMFVLATLTFPKNLYIIGTNTIL